MPTNENTNLFPALLLRLDDVQDLSVLAEAGRTLGFGLGEAFEAVLKEIESKTFKSTNTKTSGASTRIRDVKELNTDLQMGIRIRDLKCS